MKIAFLILAHSRPAQLRALVHMLNGLGTSFIHIDQAVSFDPFVHALPPSQSCVYLEDRFDIRWAGFAMVSATLALARKAMAHDAYDSFVLLSGLDYPIKSDAYILRMLGEGSQFITATPMPHLGHPLSRLDHFFFAAKNRNNVAMRAVNALLRFLPARRWRSGVLAGMTPVSGSQWWALTREAVAYILDYVETHPGFVRFFRRTKYPDEMLFQIILASSPYASRITSSSTFAEWSRPQPPWPANLDAGDLDLLRVRPELFARKFDLQKDPGIFESIDRELRISPAQTPST